MKNTFPDLMLPFVLNSVLWMSLLAAIIIGFILLLIFIYQKRRQQHTMKINKQKQFYEQELLKSQLEIQEEALRYVSQEIHDNIGQVLSLAKMELNTLPLCLESEKRPAIDHSKQLVGKAINDLRGLSKNLNPKRLNELGLEENIRYELKLLEKSKKYSTTLQVNGSVYLIPLSMQTFFFRMVQESISNILKHAAATKVQIIMDYEPHQFCVTINDDGVGFNHAHIAKNLAPGIGLKNMEYRCQIIGATFKISAIEKGGTNVRICLPKEKLAVTG